MTASDRKEHEKGGQTEGEWSPGAHQTDMQHSQREVHRDAQLNGDDDCRTGDGENGGDADAPSKAGAGHMIDGNEHAAVILLEQGVGTMTLHPAITQGSTRPYDVGSDAVHSRLTIASPPECTAIQRARLTMERVVDVGVGAAASSVCRIAVKNRSAILA
jgi:hypothetical protein